MASTKTVQQIQSNPSKAIEDYYARIQELNPKLNALIDTPTLDSLKQNLSKSSKGKLAGVPIAVKDNLSVKDWEITCSSKILKGYKAPYNATVIQKVIDEGAVLIGRANMDEFAFGSSCETSAYGPTINPWGENCVPGGSSGGSAAAVAANFAPLALGSDTGGSIRQPASFCGVVGLKPTYGRVSRYGLIAFASSLDQIGPFARNVEDAALLLEVISGYDPKDSTSAKENVPEYTKSLGDSIKGLRAGIPKEFFGDTVPADVKDAVKEAIAVLEKEGVVIQEISLPHTEYAVSVYYVVGPCEASSNLARFDGVKYGARDFASEDLLSLYKNSRENGFGAEAKRRIILGTYALSSGYYDAYYLKAMKVRKKMIEDFTRAFESVDFIVTPTSPSGAFKLGEKSDDPLQMYLSDIFTISANLTGVPGISIPCAKNKEGMPLGLQLMARPFNEDVLLNAAYAYQEASGNKDWIPENA